MEPGSEPGSRAYLFTVLTSTSEAFLGDSETHQGSHANARMAVLPKGSGGFPPPPTVLACGWGRQWEEPLRGLQLLAGPLTLLISSSPLPFCPCVNGCESFLLDFPGQDAWPLFLDDRIGAESVVHW